MAELKSSLEAALKRYGITLNPTTGQVEMLGPANLTPTQYLRRDEIAKNIYSNFLALQSSNFGKKHSVKKGEPSRGFILGGSQSFERNVQSEIASVRMARIAHSLPPYNRFPLAVISKNPLSGLFESTWQNQHNKFDHVGRRGTQDRFGPATTAIVPYSMRDPNTWKNWSSAANAVWGKGRMAGAGRDDDFNNVYTDTNWAYHEAESTPSGMDFFPPVDSEQANQWRGEKNLREEQDRLREKGRERARRTRTKQNFEYWHDVEASDYDREIFDHNKIYGSKNGESAYRKTLEKEFPQFFKNSKMSTKDMHNMAKSLRSMSKVPLLGQLIKNPTAAGIGAGMWLLNNITQSRNQSDIRSTHWQNLSGVWGKPSESFVDAAKDAGLKGEDVDKKWSSLVARFYDPSVLYGIAGMEAGPEKGMLMKILNLDEDDMRIIDKMGGAYSDESRVRARHLREAEVVKEYGFRSGTSISTKLQSLKYKIPWIGSLLMDSAAKDNMWLEQLSNRFGIEYKGSSEYNDILKTIYGEAERLYEYDSSGKNVSSAVTNNHASSATYINNLNLPSVTNPKEFAAEMESSAKTSNEAILDSFTSFE